MTGTGARIEGARVAAGLSQRALAEATGISQPTLSRIISGDRQAKMPEIVAIAWASGHTIAQLTGVETVADRVRCSTTDPGMNLMREKLLHFLELDDYLDDQAIPTERRRPQQPAAETDASGAAACFRAVNHLGEQPLGDLVAVIVQAGIDVAVLDAGPDEHGLTMRDPASGTTFIGVARTPDPMRQRSTLAHELGHVLFEDYKENRASKSSERSPAEIRADAFARHLLVPVDGLREFLTDREPVTKATLSDVVQRFLVSPRMAAIALHQAGYLDDSTKQEWDGLTASTVAARYGWSDQYRTLRGGSDQRRPPQRLLARAIEGYAQHLLSAQAIANLRGIPLDAAEADLVQAGVVPREIPVPWADPSELPEVHVDLAALERDLGAETDAG